MEKIKIEKNKKSGIALVTLFLTIIIVILLTSVGLGIAINKNYFGRAEDMKFNSNFENYKNELEDYIGNQEYLSGGTYNAESLFADNQGIYYENESITGNIKTIIPTIADDYLEDIRVYKGSLVYVGGTKEYQQKVNRETKYVTNSLKGLYDASKNNGSEFNDSSLIWKDLSENENDVVINSTDNWSDNSLKVQNVSTKDVSGTIIPISFINNSSFTIEVVYKENKLDYGNNYSDTSNYLSFVYCDNNQSNGFYLYTWNNDGSIYAGSIPNGSNLSTLIPSEIGFKVRKDVIDKISYTYNGKTKIAEIYINGDKKATKEYQNEPLAFSNLIIKGDRNYYNIRIYNRALSTSEIKQNDVVDVLQYGNWTKID